MTLKEKIEERLKRQESNENFAFVTSVIVFVFFIVNIYLDRTIESIGFGILALYLWQLVLANRLTNNMDRRMLEIVEALEGR